MNFPKRDGAEKTAGFISQLSLPFTTCASHHLLLTGLEPNLSPLVGFYISCSAPAWARGCCHFICFVIIPPFLTILCPTELPVIFWGNCLLPHLLGSLDPRSTVYSSATPGTVLPLPGKCTSLSHLNSQDPVQMSSPWCSRSRTPHSYKEIMIPLSVFPQLMSFCTDLYYHTSQHVYWLFVYLPPGCLESTEQEVAWESPKCLLNEWMHDPGAWYSPRNPNVNWGGCEQELEIIC